jgi:hypothetical protein
VDFNSFTLLVLHFTLFCGQINKKGRSPSLVGGVGVLKEEDNCVDLSLCYIRRKTAQKVAFFSEKLVKNS